MSNSVITEALPQRRRTTVASAAAILMIGFILSRVLGLARVVIQADVLGASGSLSSAFTTAITVPDLIFTLVSGGALASSFIPVFAGMLELGDEEGAWKVASGVMNGVFVVMLAAVIGGEMAAPLIVRFVASSSPATQDLTTTLTRIMLLQPLFLAISGILMGLHNSYHRFILPAIAPLIYNVANIVGLLLVGVFHNSVELAAWGVTIGALLQILVLAPGLSAFLHLIRPGVGLREPGTREVGRLMIPRIVGQAGIQLSTIVAIAVANHDYADTPSAAFRTAATLMALPVGIFGSAIATAVFPTLAGQAARGDLTALGQTVSRTLRTMLFLAIPSAIGLMVLRYPLTILFRRGAFSAHDADLVASCLLLWGVGVPVIIAVELLPRAFFALKDTWTPVLINLVTLATAIILSVAGGDLTRGNSVVGVAVLSGAVSVTVLMEVVWLVLVLRRRIPNLGLRALGLSILRALVAGEAMAAALLALLYVWDRVGPTGQLGSLLLLIVAIPLGAAVYAGWAYVVRAPELHAAWTIIRARLGRT